MASHTQQEQQSTAPKKGLTAETWMFIGLAAFFVIAALIYGLLAPTEPVGIVALGLTAAMTLIIGTFLKFVSNRLEAARPEDNDDAEVSDGAGDIGFFSPGSYFPFFLAACVALVAVATAYLLIWLMVIGVGFLLWVVCGFVYEYHRRPAHH